MDMLLILQGVSVCGGSGRSIWSEDVLSCWFLLNFTSLEASDSLKNALLLPWDFCETWTATEFSFSVFLLYPQRPASLQLRWHKGPLSVLVSLSQSGRSSGWGAGGVLVLHISCSVRQAWCTSASTGTLSGCLSLLPMVAKPLSCVRGRLLFQWASCPSSSVAILFSVSLQNSGPTWVSCLTPEAGE